MKKYFSGRRTFSDPVTLTGRDHCQSKKVSHASRFHRHRPFCPADPMSGFQILPGSAFLVHPGDPYRRAILRPPFSRSPSFSRFSPRKPYPDRETRMERKYCAQDHCKTLFLGCRGLSGCQAVQGAVNLPEDCLSMVEACKRRQHPSHSLALGNLVRVWRDPGEHLRPAEAGWMATINADGQICLVYGRHPCGTKPDAAQYKRLRICLNGSSKSYL